MQDFANLKETVERRFQSTFSTSSRYEHPESRVSVLEYWLCREDHCQDLKDAWAHAYDTVWGQIPSPRDPKKLWECISTMLAPYQRQLHEIVAEYQRPIEVESCRNFRAHIRGFIKAYRRWGHQTGQDPFPMAKVILYAHLQQNKDVYLKAADIIDVNRGEFDYTNEELVTRLCDRLQLHFGQPVLAATEAVSAGTKPAPPERPRSTPATPPVRSVGPTPAPSPASAHAKKCMFHPEATNHTTEQCKRARHLAAQERAAQAAGHPLRGHGNTTRTIYMPAAAGAGTGTQQGARNGPYQRGNSGTRYGGNGSDGGRNNGTYNGVSGGQHNSTYLNGNSGQHGGYGGQQGQNRGNNFAPRSGN